MKYTVVINGNTIMNETFLLNDLIVHTENRIDDIIVHNDNIMNDALVLNDSIMNDPNVLNDNDLLNNLYKYDTNILERNINNLTTKIVLTTQKLTPEFCIKHILDMDINGGNEDSYLFDFNYILRFQKHISEDELYNAYNNQQFN